MDPRVKPEDDNLKWIFLFVIPAGLKRESISLMSISTFLQMDLMIQFINKHQRCQIRLLIMGYIALLVNIPFYENIFTKSSYRNIF